MPRGLQEGDEIKEMTYHHHHEQQKHSTKNSIRFTSSRFDQEHHLDIIFEKVAAILRDVTAIVEPYSFLKSLQELVLSLSLLSIFLFLTDFCFKDYDVRLFHPLF